MLRGGDFPAGQSMLKRRDDNTMPGCADENADAVGQLRLDLVSVSNRAATLVHTEDDDDVK